MRNQPKIGILLGTSLLRKVIRGEPTYEKARIYYEYGVKNGVLPILFDHRGLNLKKRQVRGFVWKPSVQHYVLTVCPLPRVVHKRVLIRSPKLKALSRLLGRRLFNPDINRNKWRIHHLLNRNPCLKPHLPVTLRLIASTQGLKLLERYPIIFIKPAIGSLGKGISQIQSTVDHHYIFRPYRGKKRLLSKIQLKRALAEQHLINRHFLIQQGISLAKYHGSPFDLRVSVQKGRKGEWQISGETAKVAQGKRNLTNLSQNGKAVPAPTVLSHAFPKRNPQIILQKVRRLALEVCRTLEKTYPAFADAGLDIGVDQQGHPWLIEVNFRDLRYSFHSAGKYAMFKNTYYNPMRYAKYLLSQVVLGKVI
ncbi:YheC/YheD family protein [Polycladomyces sp. WAk]|uniref:YheC/YheD family protein n=1 Tax=Polycladomyces zharkentensis TaxID=2807616 RepID=A0ABS2WJV3_9BACL|nr:YheC/YheD family protein [Polycladomyces sp. WAk]MBN2909811.1 YheC/YheD family protein [Polycladomyces sp. WAk]